MGKMNRLYRNVVGGDLLANCSRKHHFRRPIASGIRETSNHLILQILTDSWQIDNALNPVSCQDIRISDAGILENHRTTIRSSREDHLLVHAHGSLIVCVGNLDTAGRRRPVPTVPISPDKTKTRSPSKKFKITSILDGNIIVLFASSTNLLSLAGDSVLSRPSTNPTSTPSIDVQNLRNGEVFESVDQNIIELCTSNSREGELYRAVRTMKLWIDARSQTFLVGVRNVQTFRSPVEREQRIPGPVGVVCRSPIIDRAPFWSNVGFACATALAYSRRGPQLILTVDLTTSANSTTRRQSQDSIVNICLRRTLIIPTRRRIQFSCFDD